MSTEVLADMEDISDFIIVIVDRILHSSMITY